MSYLQSFTIGVGQLLDTSGSYGHLSLDAQLGSYRPCGINDCANNVKEYIKKAVDVKSQQIHK